MARWPHLVVCGVLMYGSTANGQLVIDRNLTIAPSNSLPDTAIQVVDGALGATTVSIAAGGHVGTQTVQASEITGQSAIELNEGGSLGPVVLLDEGQYRHRGSVLPYFDPSLPLLHGVVVANSSSTVILSAGDLWAMHNVPGIVAQDSSQVEVTGGVLHHLASSPGIVAEGNSHVHVAGGEIAGGSSSAGVGIHATESSRVVISGGTVRSSDALGVLAVDSSSVEITGGSVASSDSSGIRLGGEARLMVTGGAIRGDTNGIWLVENSTLEMVDGRVDGLRLTDTASAKVSGGQIRNGDNFAVVIDGNARLDISGGAFAGEDGGILVSNAGLVNLTGGTVGHLDDNAAELVVTDSSIVNIFGFDLETANGRLSGFLSDGSPLAWNVETHDAAQVVIHELPPPVRPGDYDRNDVVDAHDIDILAHGIRANSLYVPFDLDSSGTVDSSDRRFMVEGLLNTWFGDADLNGTFDSSDLIQVLASGTYESGLESNWATGDFDGSGTTTSSDFVLALADGGYAQGPRPAVTAVPEPSSVTMLMLGFFCMVSVPRSRR